MHDRDSNWNHGGKMKPKMGFLKTVSLCLGLVVLSVALCRAQAQSSTLKYEVDPTWPKPLPENWVTGQVSGVCVDGQDHVFIVNRKKRNVSGERQQSPATKTAATGSIPPRTLDAGPRP
jgi:Tfp pilus assembly protein PilX